MKNIVLLFIIINLFIGCNSDEIKNEIPRPPINKSSFIQGFYDLNDIHISPLSGIIIDKNNRIVDFSKISFDHPNIYDLTNGIGIGIFIIDNENGIIKPNTDRYNALVDQIGDTSFNTSARFGYTISPYPGVVSIVDTIQYVNITCNKQFDENHPIGSSLNDLFTIYYEDPYSVIKNGYKSVYGINHYSVKDLPLEESYPLYVVGNKLNNINFNFNKEIHIGSVWFLVLDKEPEKTDEYIFSISVCNNKGKELKETSSNGIKIKGYH